MSEVRRVISLLDRFTTELVIALSTNIVARLVETTPVDTGWARANWVPSIGVALDTTVGSPEGVSTAAHRHPVAHGSAR